MIRVLITLFSILTVSYCSYYKVVYETCDELRSTSNFFDKFLLPCATYSYNPVVLTCLTDEEEEADLKKLPKWTLTKNDSVGDSIFRSYEFNNFRTAFLFMSEGAQLAETNQHHPDWRNLYNVVDVTLTTDDQKCLSTFDIQLAQGLDYLYALVAK